MTRAMFAAFALALPALFAVGAAWADCPPLPAGAVELSFEVRRCTTVRAPWPDRRRLLRIEVADPGVRLLADSGEEIAAAGHDAVLVEGLRATRVLYVDAGAGAHCGEHPVGAARSATLQPACCDTLPHRGTCRLPGPVVVLD
ncbi:hypothetical protein [Arenimonas composti]|uniref:Uncharacterized protein n=2 Tax=Arenimonas TaxID=490567 RepID=A0A091BH59_9GAMM|nr:hypothetical protein [Arenimonas composti]KFN50124.1 hypothetical protein P873_08090 [Arenimonas composti TR7-09 = DSM 18010]